MLPAIIGALGAMASAGINAASTSYNNSLTFAQNKDLMKLQDELQGARWESQFNRTNSYNSPANQVQLLKEAGINPLYDSSMSGTSGFSPASNIGLNSSDARPVGFNADFGEIASNLLNAQMLKLEERKVKAQEKKTDADIVNQTEFTQSEIAVNSSRILNDLKNRDLSDSEIKKNEAEANALLEATKQNWLRISQGEEKLWQDWQDFYLRQYNSKWQESVAKQGAATDRMNAVTNRMNNDVANRTLQFQVGKYKVDFEKEFELINMELSQNKTKMIEELYKSSQIRVMGVNTGWTSKEVARVSGAITAFWNNQAKMSMATKMKLLPMINEMQDLISRTSVNQNYNSSDKSWQSPYMPKDASDGF